MAERWRRDGKESGRPFFPPLLAPPARLAPIGPALPYRGHAPNSNSGGRPWRKRSASPRIRAAAKDAQTSSPHANKKSPQPVDQRRPRPRPRPIKSLRARSAAHRRRRRLSRSSTSFGFGAPLLLAARFSVCESDRERESVCARHQITRRLAINQAFRAINSL